MATRAEMEKLYATERIDYMPIPASGGAAGAGAARTQSPGEAPILDAVPVVATVVPNSTALVVPPNTAVYYAGKTPQLDAQRRGNGNLGGFGVLFVRVGHLQLEGSYIVPETLDLFVVLHGARIDLSRATFVHPRTTIRVFACLGGVKITVPPNVMVSMSGVGILGGFKQVDGSLAAADLNAPTLHVTGMTVLGGCKVRVDHAARPCLVVQ